MDSSSLVSFDAHLALGGLLDLDGIVRDSCSFPQAQLPDPLPSMLPNLAFGVKETRLAIEEGDEVGGTMDRDGPPEEGRESVRNALDVRRRELDPLAGTSKDWKKWEKISERTSRGS